MTHDLRSMFSPGIQFDDGGGDWKGKGVGIVEGMVGSGGRVTLGRVGWAGFGKDGTLGLGNGGNIGLGRDGFVGKVGSLGKELEGRGGIVGLGSVGSEGNGGNMVLGIYGILGNASAGGEAAAVTGVSKRWRAARLFPVLESDNTTMIATIKKLLGRAMFSEEYEVVGRELFCVYEQNSKQVLICGGQ